MNEELKKQLEIFIYNFEQKHDMHTFDQTVSYTAFSELNLYAAAKIYLDNL